LIVLAGWALQQARTRRLRHCVPGEIVTAPRLYLCAR
jgi:hypothetical protein